MPKYLISILALLLTMVAPATAQTPSFFKVSVSGANLQMHDFNQGAFGLFEFTKPVDVEIRADFNVRWVDVRPRSSGIKAEIGPDHRTIRFRITEARPVTIEFNRDLGHFVQLFPYRADKNAPAASTPNVRYFGPGVHEAGRIMLKDGETLYLAAGAWVKGNVSAIGAKNVSIRGRGVLDGIDVPKLPPLPESEAGNMPAYARDRKNMIYFEDVQGAKIEGITITNSAHWTVFTRRCRDLHVDGVNILNTSNRYGNDGFDVVSCSDVLIENVWVRTNDDCVVVKNLDDVEMKNIEVRRSIFWNQPIGGNAIEVGFEMRNKTVSNLVFRDCDIIHVERGAAISIHQGDASLIENVWFDDIRVEDVRRKVIDFCVLYAQYGLDKPETQEERNRRMDPGGVWDGEQRQTPEEYKARAANRGHVRNVHVRNLHIIEGALPYSVIAGYDAEHAIENVTIENYQYQGRVLRTAEDAKLVTHDVKNVVIR